MLLHGSAPVGHNRGVVELTCPAAGDRLDKLIARCVASISRGEARRLIAAGAVFIDGRRCRIASYLVRPGQKVRVSEDAPVGAGEPLTVLYEDHNCIAIDKPAAMPSAATQSAAAGTAMDLLRDQLRKRSGRVDLKLVHRLDAATSGVLLFAKTADAARRLSSAFAAQGVGKTYVARVQGSVADESGCIDFAIASARGRAVISPEGRAATTQWQVIGRSADSTLLELTPQTGRMHQLRVHLQAIGHPVVGDRWYGGPPASRLMLHALRLEFPDPQTGAPRTIEARPPPEILAPGADRQLARATQDN